MRKILICGYFGFNNAGDELILSSIVNSIRKKQIEEFKISVLLDLPGFRRFIDGVKPVNRWNLFDVLFSLIGNDIIIFSGGLFQDTTGSSSLYYYLSLVFFSRLFGKKIIFCGMDFGPIIKGRNRKIFAAVCRPVREIYPRSQGSLDFLNCEGFKLDEKRLSSDVLFTNRVAGRQKAHDGFRSICLILRKRAGQGSGFDLGDLCRALEEKYHPVFNIIPFQQEEDVYYSLETLKASGLRANISRWNKPEDLFYILGGADLIISQRLHGLIIGTLLRIPVIAVPFDPKLRYFMREIRLDALIYELNGESPHDFLKRAEFYMRNFKGVSDDILRRLEYKSETWLESLKN